MRPAANDVASIGSAWLHDPADAPRAALTAEMANDLAQSIAISIAIQRGLLQVDLDELRRSGVDLEGPCHAIRSWSCDQCRAWAAALEERGPLPLDAVAHDARTREAIFEAAGQQICASCLAEREGLLDTAATLELTTFALAPLAEPRSVLEQLDLCAGDPKACPASTP